MIRNLESQLRHVRNRISKNLRPANQPSSKLKLLHDDDQSNHQVFNPYYRTLMYLIMLYNMTCPSKSLKHCQDLMPDEEKFTSPQSLEDVFSHNIRTVQILYQKNGLDGLQRLRDNISNVSLISLFSGLGGAELLLENTYVAVSAVCESVGLSKPRRPSDLVQQQLPSLSEKYLS